MTDANFLLDVMLNVTEVIENTRLVEVLKTKKSEIAQAHKIKGTNMIANRVPIIRNGKVEGAFGRVLFKNKEDIQAATGCELIFSPDLKPYAVEDEE